MALVHGGRLRQAASATGIGLERWLDLSTGISPWAYPVTALPEACWQRLPEDDDGLIPVARRWAGAGEASGCVAVAGSQAAIEVLPRLRPPGHVAVVEPGYAEHAWCWQKAGHQVHRLCAADMDAGLQCTQPLFDVVVWLQPNNPTGEYLPVATLQRWQRQLAARGGWLVVDEAFVDSSAAPSLIAQCDEPGLVLMRSVGKFFGLAGIRGGFVFAERALCGLLSDSLGPWSVSGPARTLMKRALADAGWQERQRARLKHASLQLQGVLERSGFTASMGTELFRYVPCSDAASLYQHLLQQAILVRLFEQPLALRFGLPANSQQLERLADALADWCGNTG